MVCCRASGDTYDTNRCTVIAIVRTLVVWFVAYRRKIGTVLHAVRESPLYVTGWSEICLLSGVSDTYGTGVRTVLTVGRNRVVGTWFGFCRREIGTVLIFVW